MFCVLLFVLAIDNEVATPVWKKPLSVWNLYTNSYMAASEDGLICWLDWQTKELVFINADGKEVARHSRKGEGPGELSQVSAMGWLAIEKMFWVWDSKNYRISFWTEKGLIKESKYLPGWFRGREVLMINQEQGFYLKDNFGKLGSTPGVYRFKLSNESDEPFYRHPELEKQVGLHYAEKGQNINAVFEWDPKLIFAFNQNLLAVAYSDKPEIKLFALEPRKQLNSLEHAVPRRPVRDSDREEIIQREIPEYMRNDLLPSLVVPEYWPMTESISIDPAGRIWAFGFPKDSGDPVPFRVFDQAGATLFTGKLPAKPRFLQKNHIYFCKESGDEEEYYLEKWRIDKLLNGKLR